MKLLYFRRMFQTYSRLTCLTLVFALIFAACEDPDLVGLDVLPPGDTPGVYRVDTFSVNAYTQAEDSLITSRTETPLFCGSLDDVPIGRTDAGFVIQARIGNTISSTTFDGATAADSIVLVFAYRSRVGDSTATHRISVYELGESISKDSLYYSNRTFTKSTLVGHVDKLPDLNDSVLVGSSNVSPQLRLALDTAFGGRILREYISNPAIFADNITWLNYLKGLLIVDSADGTGSILTLEPNSAINKLTLYYSGNKSYDFTLDANSARASYFNHAYVTQFTDTLEDLLPAIQSMAGLKMYFKFPWLEQLKNIGPLSINQAELVFKLQPNTNSDAFEPHDNLLVFQRDADGKNALIIDALESSSYYGGVYDNVNKEYRFNIARHVQRILNGSVTDYGLFLVAGGSTSNAQRTLLLGGSDIKLIISYTLFTP